MNGFRDRAVRSISCLLGFVTLSVPTLSQWGWNPRLESTPATLVPIDSSVAGVSMQFGGVDGVHFRIRRLDNNGNATPSFTWSEPNIHPFCGFAACSLGSKRLAIAYQLEDLTIRVAMFDYDSGSFALDPAFPVSIGTGVVRADPFFIVSHEFLAIAPNKSSGGMFTLVDGVWVAWLSYGPPGDVQIRQQGVQDNGALIFLGANGAHVWDNSAIPGTAVMNFEPIEIITDDAGLAIVVHSDYSPTAAANMVDGSVHRTTKLGHLLGVPFVLWSLEVPGQDNFSFSPGTCLATADGTGGAFYSYPIYRAASTELITARVNFDDTIEDSNSFWSLAVQDEELRSMSLVSAPGETAVLTYRDAILCAALKFQSTAGLPIAWAAFLSGATDTNTDAADSVVVQGGACGDSVYIGWTRFSQYLTQRLDLATGTSVWGTQVNTVDGNAPIFPRVMLGSNRLPGKILYGWYDHGIKNPIQTGMFAERLKCATGVVGKKESPKNTGTFEHSDGITTQ